MADEAQPTRKRIRRLSLFLCREMLYDFATGQLDPERKRAVEEFLKNNEEQREELEELRMAMDYCQDLATTRVAEPLVEEFKNTQPPLAEFARRLSWKEWPEFLRWGLEALTLSAVVAVIAIAVPWEKVRDLLPESQRKYVLAEREKKRAAKTESESVATGAPEAVKETAPPPPSQPAANTDSAATVAATPRSPPPPPTAPAPGPGPAATPGPVAATPETKTPPAPAAEPSPVLMAKRSGAEVAQPVEDLNKKDAPKPTTVVKVKEGTPDQALKGSLYRATMINQNLESVTPLMKAEIEKLGGEKAGQVELGWKQSENTRYFHFTLPEANYEAMLKTLRYFGPVRISKESHWRVMPEGQIRIILTVEDSKTRK